MRSSAEAAAEAGVVIRELREIGEFERVHRLFDDIWHPAPSNVPATMEMMVGFAHTGNYVAGAFAGDVLVGASVGFLASGNSLHSHVTGAVAGKGIGYALKLHQREWSLERGLERITWTFDPLVRRNARFNLVKLGARPEEYLRDFYGVMTDAINEGDASDRLLAVWHLRPGAAPQQTSALQEGSALRVASAVQETSALGVASALQGAEERGVVPRDPTPQEAVMRASGEPSTSQGVVAREKDTSGEAGAHEAASPGAGAREIASPGTGAREIASPGTGAREIASPGTGARKAGSWEAEAREAGVRGGAEQGAPITEACEWGEVGAAVREGGDGWPVRIGGDERGWVVVGTPRDVERLRREEPEAAKAWRMVVREVLGGAIEAGGEVVGFTDQGEYVVVIN